jgi:hypothetical protein
MVGIINPYVFGGGGSSPTWAFEWYAETEGLSNAASVTQLTDTSGNSNHATQGTAGKRGTYTTSGLGGKAYVNFDGGDDTYNFTSAIAAATSFTIYVVWYAVATGPGGEHDVCLVGGANTGISYQMNNHPFSPNMSPLLASSSAYQNSGQSLLPRDVWHQTNVSFEDGPDNWAFRADKVAGNSGTNAHGSWSPGIQYVGTFDGNNQRPWLGRIAAILIATDAHDLTTKQSVENDLSTFFSGAV